MLDVSVSRRGVGVFVATVAAGILVLAAAGVALQFLGAPAVDCPPLGNGGAMQVGQPVESVDAEAEALAVVRTRLQARDATTTPRGPTATNATTTGATASATRTATATTAFRTGGHFRGREQVHGGLSRGESVPEHYHVHVDAGPSTLGYVVTADGDLYRIIYGDC